MGLGLFNRPKRDTLTRTTSWPVYGADLTVDEITPPQALAIADVFACVRVLAESVSCLPLVPYRELVDGSRVRFSGRLSDLLQRPAPGLTQSSFLSTITAHLTLHGNAFIGKYRRPDGTVEQMAPLHPWQVAVRLIEGEPSFQYYSLDGVEDLTTADVVHIKTLSTDGIVGLSPVRQASQALTLAQNLSAHASSFVKNGGRPGGILRVPGWRSAQGTASEDIRGDWESKFVGTDNSGRLLLITGDEDVSFTQLALSFEDAQFVLQRQMSSAEIARIFRIPAWMIDIAVPERGITYKNASEQADAFLRFTLTPYLKLIEEAVTNDPDLSPQTVFCEFDLDALLRPDPETRAAYYAAALNPQTGWMTRGEVRQRENLPSEENQ